MPLLVPVAVAIAVVLGACMLWAENRYVRQRRYGVLAALIAASPAVASVWVLVAAGPSVVMTAVGWSLLAASAACLIAAWFALRAWAPPL